MSRNFKNVVLHKHGSVGSERRKSLAKEVLRDNTPLPKPLNYEDIDREFKRWVDEELEVEFEGKKLPTMVLYSNQRFSEYRQSWEFTDDKRNLILNFKTVTRETNPKNGELNGSTRNIPGERLYLINRVLTHDESGREFFTDYKMKQPYTIDLNYQIGIVTNKIELINIFNQKVTEKFKSIDCYIRPNGHFIPMKLENIEDNSKLSLDDREYYSQKYSITVMAYIITSDSLVVEENPVLKFSGVDVDYVKGGAGSVQIEDFDDNTSKITATFIPNGADKKKFHLDSDMCITGVECNNVRKFDFYVNDDKIELRFVDGKCYTQEYVDEDTGELVDDSFDTLCMVEGSELKIKNVVLYDEKMKGQISFIGEYAQKS